MFYVNIMKNGHALFFISCLVLIAVKTGNDVSTFGGSASIVSGMRPV